MTRSSAWRTAPLWSRLVFLAAVFFIFASFGFVSDSSDMGRLPPLRLALSVLVSAVFPVSYAAAGVILRGKFWKAFLPLFALHFLSMFLVARLIPEAPEANQLNAAAIEHLHGRLAFDGIAIIISISIGYAAFVVVSISEGRRYIRIQTEKTALESEMAAAREVQRVMVPEALPATPGYAIESVYRPASEVGGDFFQVIPLKSGRTLVIIGDVSGKGLRAAMIVSMIVGMLRTVGASTEEPAEILSELNRRLCGRMHDGFATCLAVRLEDDGWLTIANAGHLAPYLNGAELPFAGTMPLGMVETVTYEQTGMEMQPGEVAILLTDGVAEAQNERGVLLGFSGVESLLRDGANATTLADAAQHYGQADDITVISVARAI
jgi:hypothetical protein